MGFFDVLGVLGFFVILFLFVQLFRIIFSDCDLGLRGRTLKWEYFSGKVVWVVGASGGIGEQLCCQLSHVGAKIVLSDLPQQTIQMEGLVNQFVSSESSRIVDIDLTDLESLESVVRNANSAFGHVDILILAAGVMQFESLVKTPIETDRRVMDINYNGQKELIRLVLNGMALRRSGHIVGISSFAGKVGMPRHALHCASKFALLGMLEALKYELYPCNIRVTTVCPGAVDTPLLLSCVQSNGMAHSNHIGVQKLLTCFKRFSITPVRCAELILIAVSNELEEIWIGQLPYVGLMYARQYSPSLCNFIVKRICGKSLND